MRILQVTHSFFPHLGGQERYIYYLGTELTKLGHEVGVLTTRLDNTPRVEKIDGLTVTRYKCVARILRNPVTPGILIPDAHLRTFDLIHAHNEHTFAAVACVLLKRFLNLPLVISCHGHGDSIFGNRFMDSFEDLYSRTVSRAVLNAADRVIVATPSERDFLCTRGVREEKVTIIPVGVDSGTWAPYFADDTAAFKEKHRLNGNRVILVATQIIKRKGIEYLVQALPQILQSFPDTICLIVGNGDYRAKIEQLVARLNLGDSVRLTGWLNGRELAMAHRCSNVFVLPSLCEGQPTCIMEAFLFSTPVVSTAIDGTRDYFQEVASLVPPRDVDGLADAITGLLANPEEARRQGREGQRLVESSFAWPRIASRILDVYEDVLSTRKRIPSGTLPVISG